MPGLVSVKTPPDAPLLRIQVPETDHNNIQNHEEEEEPSIEIRTPTKTRSPIPKRPPSPSPSTSRTKPSPKPSPGKKKTTPEKQPKIDESALDNPDLGPFLLKLARDTIASGDSPNKALDFAIRASKSFERCAGGEGLKVQMEALGETDPRVAETCRYLAEAHVQAMQFDDAEVLCKKTLEIHQEHSAPASLEEAADRRLMALICEAKGDYESALEHLVLASMAMIANGQENEVAAIDIGIGDIYLSLSRFDEAVFSYQKALTVFKSTKGDNHPSVASVFARLADLYYKTGRLRESKSYCESALRIYAKPVPGTTAEEIASGMMEISAIYEAVDEPEEALKLLQKAMKLLEDTPGQRNTIAGIEAQMGVMLYMVGRYGEAWSSFESAVAKLRASGERKSAFFGVVLNQMGLACVQMYKIDEASELFEEARGILEQECGPCHPDTLGVYSNLAATYDAMGRVEDAIEILEYILKVREEKLGTANPDVEDERKRLAELLKEAGKARNKKTKSLENLLGSKSERVKKEAKKKWSSLGFKS
ncbi:hypothetical protein AQUCO_01300060v1 [Aquilegia coerulea]|uniref:Uncharacterized protein n=1 Tax=Aquilegia coerulea TaxID=218851 RepID=A0A2G5DZL3_AQUCA|nr:hypothetical protein AQUCO_01300060v1 [Aquilegia coerulea]